MKKVYLVHESGKKYGPFEGDLTEGFIIPRQPLLPDIQNPGEQKILYTALRTLGFEYEEALPEQITITLNDLLQANAANRGNCYDLWKTICELAQKNKPYDRSYPGNVHPPVDPLKK